MLLSVKQHDEAAFERNYNQLRVYYSDVRAALPPSDEVGAASWLMEWRAGAASACLSMPASTCTTLAGKLQGACAPATQQHGWPETTFVHRAEARPCPAPPP